VNARKSQIKNKGRKSNIILLNQGP